MVTGAAFFDLDRTLVPVASPRILQRHLADHGLASSRGSKISDVFYTLFEWAGESRLVGPGAQMAAKAAAGWPVDDTARAATAAASEIVAHVSEFARHEIEGHHQAGRRVVLATTTPEHLVRPVAERLGIADVVATRWIDDDGEYRGEVDGPIVWGTAKRDAVRAWASEHGVDLSASYAYSDSYYDAPLLDAVGHPVAVNPDARLAITAVLNGWPIRHLDKPAGVMKLGTIEVQDLVRPFMRPGTIPNADITLNGLEHIPADGPAIVVANHRSYFDPVVMISLLAQSGRNVRILAKRELFDIAVLGPILQAAGGIAVDRDGDAADSLSAARDSLRGGDVVLLFPQGTIPRGPAFFEPELEGRWGAARLAKETRAPVIPVGVWGTEAVWPRNARLPGLGIGARPPVSATVGSPVKLHHRSLPADTRRIMTAIVDLLPAEARARRSPTPEELAATYPPGQEATP